MSPSEKQRIHAINEETARLIELLAELQAEKMRIKNGNKMVLRFDGNTVRWNSGEMELTDNGIEISLVA
jgi:hypothetical protein